MSQKFEMQFAFFEELWRFYSENRGKVRSRYNELTRKFLAYNDRTDNPGAFLRPPQFEALEMYVFIKEFLDNPQAYEVFDAWRRCEGVFSDRSYYSLDKGQGTLTDEFTEKQTDAVFKAMKKYQEEYPNYIYALTMGLGKTILMATCIFYEFLLANKYPKDGRFVHNALVFAPDKTVLESLREIVTFDKSKVVPPEYVQVLEANIKISFLDDPGVTLNTLDDSDFNIVISNAQKIIVKKKRKAESAAEMLFSGAGGAGSILGGLYEKFGAGDDDVVDEASLTENQRFQKLTRLRHLGVYVDEAHHLFGANLEKALRAKKADKTSLRDTINILAKRTDVVACYNFTGTPYVNRQPLPEVVYAYGLRESIQKGYLKEAHPKGFENVKNAEFLRGAVTEFWETYGDQSFEGLSPKLAIFAATIEEAVEEVRPVVEEVLSGLGVSSEKILVNVGDAKYTKDEDIRNFNNLDVPGSVGNEKQFIILVEKGREGWNCRSLFGVAMFRSPKSKVFVLQATMRCLRSITDEQQTALVFLSKENFDVLDAELEKSFNMDLDMLAKKESKPKKTYQVRMVPPERTIKLKRIWREYELEMKQYSEPVDFQLGSNDELQEKYGARVWEKAKISSLTKVKDSSADEMREETPYSLFTLTGELCRYFNLSPILLNRILRESIDGTERIVEVASRYNEVIYDCIVPAIFHALYHVTYQVRTEEKELVLLREPENAGYYEFKAAPELVVEQDNAKMKDSEKAKTFHASTYCFDSKPELELFWQYVEAEQVKHVYFTGMFTSAQSDFSIPYYDPQSQRVRHYNPDFYAEMADGSIQIIEVKGDNMVDDPVVQAKAEATREIVAEGEGYMEYKFYPSNEIMHSYVLSPEAEHEKPALDLR